MKSAFIRHWFSLFALLLALLAPAASFGQVVLPPNLSKAVAWYDALGYPDVGNLPYIRFRDGGGTKLENGPFQWSTEGGFLVSEDPSSFTVFVCELTDFESKYFQFVSKEPYLPLTTVRILKDEHHRYDVVDFKKAADDGLASMSKQVSRPFPEDHLTWGAIVSNRLRIFALGRACLQKGLPEDGLALINIAANIPDEQTGQTDPANLAGRLQRNLGDAVISEADSACGDLTKSWSDILKYYENFGALYPASDKIALAGESADLLKKMIAADAAHHPGPIATMTPDEQAAEYIYQLRNVKDDNWVMYQHYPDDGFDADGKPVETPVDHLIDLGPQAIPQLIAALEDRSFTRSFQQSFNALFPPWDLRVCDLAERALEHISGRIVRDVNRQQAEAWWSDVQAQGEKAVLIHATEAGGANGAEAARRLVEKYPDAALAAVELGIRATPVDGERSEYVDALAALPGDAVASFLKTQLDPGAGLYTQVAAAKALRARGLPDGIPAMIAAWSALQARLATNQNDVFLQTDEIIAFLAHSESTAAIEALQKTMPNAPVYLRLSIVQVFQPIGNGGKFANGASVQADSGYRPDKFPAATLPFIERLLRSALKDTGKLANRDASFNGAHDKDPRVCDMAAQVLSARWPEKYRFQRTASAADCDGQIAKMLAQGSSGSE